MDCLPSNPCVRVGPPFEAPHQVPTWCCAPKEDHAIVIFAAARQDAARAIELEMLVDVSVAAGACCGCPGP